MCKVIDSVRSPRIAQAIVIGTFGLIVAGCSSDVTRFSQPLFGGSSSETQYTGSITPSPVPEVERQELADPGGQFAVPPVAAQDGQTASANTVIAQPGDTAHSIARRFGIPHTALMQANGLSDANAVRPGQQLVIPTYSQSTSSWQAERPSSRQSETRDSREAAAPARDESPRADRQEGGSHRVGQGETVFSIARAYNVGHDEIIRANGLDSPDRIRVGQRLTIPGASGASGASQTASAEQRQQSEPASRPAAEERQTEQVAQAETPRPVPASLTTGGGDAPSQADTSAGVSDPAPMSAGTFRWPVRGRVISAFGDTSNGSRNDGVKISVPEGSSVRAAENGVVAYAGDELKGYGNLVLIRHADDWVSAYAHNSEISVNRGDQVSRGQVIAKAGQTGSVNSPQLHFELRKGSQPVDPLRYLAEN